MATLIEAPNKFYEKYSLQKPPTVRVFLAGGISNCPDWQAEMNEKLKDVEGIAVFNPRRANFPMGDPKAAQDQITWEYVELEKADIIVFWFSRGSINPIVLYELGMWGNSRVGEKISIIGCDPEYERIQDVEIQSQLAGNNSLHYTLQSVADQVKKEVRKHAR